MAEIIQSRMRAIRRQAETLQRAATTPTGIFETVDEIIKNVRRANQETIRQLTRGAGFSPQRLDMRRLRERIRIPRW
jgi:hypothetical protein